MMDIDEVFLLRAIDLSRQGMLSGSGGPFGCVIVKDGKIIGEGFNEVLSSNDPTAHAEIVAIRNACKVVGTFQLTGCDVYASCEPCPMCLGAIYWARPARLIYANTKADAASIGFDDEFIYGEIDRPGNARAIPFIHVPNEKALDVFITWKNKMEKEEY
jgi:tRNA(Arg) A34 adenosine deaminase TadA